MILCADDFGLSAGISEAVLELCQHQKIQATSVMTEAPLLEAYAACLRDCQPRPEIGLHFNLTEPLGRPAFPLIYLMAGPWLPLRIRQDISARLREQLTRFEQVFGCSPDFVDGHQHVHVFPAIRPLFIQVLTERYPPTTKRPWIRQVSAPLTHTDTKLKTVVLKLLNLGFKRRCERAGFACNQRFDGIYSLRPVTVYPRLLQAWLRRADEDTLVMCHPSRESDSDDALTQARYQEFLALKKLPTEKVGIRATEVKQ